MAKVRYLAPAAPTLGPYDVQTTRAEELADFLEVFERFLIAREATLDQIAAERALGRLMGPDR